MRTNALIIFTRNPALGKVKTRLAKTIGDQKALEIYKDLLAHTKNVTLEIGCDKFVFYDAEIVQEDLWETIFYEKKLQMGNDLGARMAHAFETLFALGYKNCVIVGSDLFDLKAQHINEAFEGLKVKDVVIGPAEDGGYYLLGLKKMIPTLFKNKNWGTSTVFTETMKDLENYNKGFLETLNDIDTFEDLEKTKYYQEQFLKLYNE